jgi:hypothetical protein
VLFVIFVRSIEIGQTGKGLGAFQARHLAVPWLQQGVVVVKVRVFLVERTIKVFLMMVSVIVIVVPFQNDIERSGVAMIVFQNQGGVMVFHVIFFNQDGVSSSISSSLSMWLPLTLE